MVPQLQDNPQNLPDIAKGVWASEWVQRLKGQVNGLYQRVNNQSSGSTGTPNIDTVLAQGGTLTTDRTIDVSNKTFGIVTGLNRLFLINASHGVISIGDIDSLVSNTLISINTATGVISATLTELDIINSGGVTTAITYDATVNRNRHDPDKDGTYAMTNDGIYLLSTTGGIDGTQTGTTGLFTPDADTIVTMAIVRVTAGDTITVPPTAGIGISGSDIYASTSLLGLTNRNLYYTFANNGISAITQLGQNVNLNIDTGATATTMVLSVDLYGYIIPS